MNKGGAGPTCVGPLSSVDVEWASPGKQDGQDGMNRQSGEGVEVYARSNGVRRS